MKTKKRSTVLRSKKSNFYIVMTGLLLLLVFVGFSRSFYFQPFGELPPLSRPLHVHGALLTAWYVLLFTQALLVRSKKIRLHRRLGIAGGVLAVGVVASSSWILALRDAPYVDQVPDRGFGNLMSLVAFSLCVGLGVLLRHRPAWHKRLMLLGSIIIAAPGIDRIAQIPAIATLLDPILPDAFGSTGVAFAALGALSLLLTVLIHDLFVQRRPHWATISALVFIFLLAPGITWVLIETGLWPAFVRLVL